MNSSLTIQELRDLIGIENLSQPAMDDTVRTELGVATRIIDDLGLPKRFAEWFKCLKTLVLSADTQGKSYFMNNDEKTIERAVAVGQNEFGTHVIDCDTGCLVYIDMPRLHRLSGETQLINTSIGRFYQFIAHFNKASSEGFDSSGTLRTAFETIDSAPLCDTEGIWSVTLESAEAGLF